MAEKIRLDKLIANMGYGSRKEVRTMVKRGQVRINGQVVKTVDQAVDPAVDEVICRGEHIVYEPFIYLMMHKPAGYVSANVDKRDATVMELLPFPYCNMELFVAGRLDKDTEGLLILTNDGKFAHNMLSPKKHVPKTYYAHIAGKVTEDDIVQFAQGVTLDDGYKTMPAQLQILASDDQSEIQLTIHEGKFHQVKRMFESVGKQVIYLKRIQIGTLPLDETLSLSEVKKLTLEEKQAITAQ